MVHPKSQLKTVKELLIKDLLFSLKNRLEIVAESFGIEEIPFLINPKFLVVQMPKRVFFTLSNCVLNGYTHGDVEALQALVSNLVNVKPLLCDFREQSPEIAKNEENPVAPSDPPKKTNFLTSVVTIFAILVVSFIIKKI